MIMFFPFNFLMPDVALTDKDWLYISFACNLFIYVEVFYKIYEHILFVYGL